MTWACGPPHGAASGYRHQVLQGFVRAGADCDGSRTVPYTTLAMVRPSMRSRIRGKAMLKSLGSLATRSLNSRVARAVASLGSSTDPPLIVLSPRIRDP